VKVCGIHLKYDFILWVSGMCDEQLAWQLAYWEIAHVAELWLQIKKSSHQQGLSIDGVGIVYASKYKCQKYKCRNNCKAAAAPSIPPPRIALL